MILVVCPKCGTRFRARNATAGKRGKCSQCGEILIISSPDPSSADEIARILAAQTAPLDSADLATSSNGDEELVDSADGSSSSQSALDRFGRLPEWARVVIGVVGLLGVIILSIIAVVYSKELSQAILLILGLVAISAPVVWGWYLLATSKQSTDEERVATQLAVAAEAEERSRLLRDRAVRLRAIAEGEVAPWPDTAGVFLRNSEVLWYRCSAQVERKEHWVSGTFCVTSLRLLFLSGEYPIEVPIGMINAVNLSGNLLTVIAKTPSATNSFNFRDTEIVRAYIERAVKAFHRQVDVGFEQDYGRQIPQDVKTVVWQRDGGRCVACGARDYLEFDHIIPYAKGGANTVDNVQLLCRRCNLNKRDRI